jgi:hypothetical protein
MIGVKPRIPHDPPHLSDRSENVCEERLIFQHEGKALQQRPQLGLAHRLDQIVEHAARAERMDAVFDGVGLEHPITRRP